MQGWYGSKFEGKKKELDKLLEFIKSQESQMYKIIYQEDIKLPKGYDNLDGNDHTNSEIGMGSSYNINWFNPYEYFSDVVEAAPELEMEGFYSLNDGPEIKYYSAAGSLDYSEDYVSRCDYCGLEGSGFEEDYESTGACFCSRKCYLSYCEDYDHEPNEEYLELLGEDDIQSDDETSRIKKIISEWDGVSEYGTYLKIDVVGTGYEGRANRFETLEKGQTLVLHREPENKYDSNAIEVQNNKGESLGHIPGDKASVLSPAMDEGRISILLARIEEVVPLSVLGKRFKNPRLVIGIKIQYKE